MKSMRIVRLATIGCLILFAAVSTSAQTSEVCGNPANAVVAENCLPGSSDWIVESPDPSLSAFVFPPSVNVGEPVNLYIASGGVPVDVDIYRLGYYGGAGGRLITQQPAQPIPAQPACNEALYDTGLVSCLNWAPIEQQTDSAWVSGIYVAHIARPDTGGENLAVFVVRDDARGADLLFQQSNHTFQAYNNFGGKSVYDYNSGWDAGYCNTVSENPRAVSVSLARPYTSGGTNNVFDTEYPLLRWLEQQGYDVSYATDWDTDRWGEPENDNLLLRHSVYMSAGHDEYWTEAMRDAVAEARDAGVHLAFFSANTIYWRVRLEADPWMGTPDSVMTVYKTIEDGVPDPSGHPTTTFRDPVIDDPENALIGTMYIGDNSGLFFPVRVSGEFASDPIYRHTDLQELAPDTYVDIGDDIVGWEWQAIVDNSLTPVNLDVLARSPVVGFLLIDAGNSSNGTSGQAYAETTRYIAESGAQVFSTGTILWGRGLGAHGTEPVPVDPYVQQVTVNVLADMGLPPGSPAADVVLDGEDRVVTSAVHPVRQIGDAEPPVVLSLSVDTSGGLLNSGRTATFRWTTDRPTRGQVWLGPASGNTYEEAAESREFAADHEVQYDGLVPGTTYYVRIASMDEQNGQSLSDETTFATPPNLIHTLGAPLLRGWRSLGCFTEDYPIVTVAGALLLTAAVVVGAAWLVLRRRKPREQSNF